MGEERRWIRDRKKGERKERKERRVGGLGLYDLRGGGKERE